MNGTRTSLELGLAPIVVVRFVEPGVAVARRTVLGVALPRRGLLHAVSASHALLELASTIPVELGRTRLSGRVGKIRLSRREGRCRIIGVIWAHCMLVSHLVDVVARSGQRI